MAKVVVLYGTPTDPQAFDTYYANVHTPLARTMPGVRKIEVSRGPIMGPTGPAPYHLVASLSFDSMAAIQQAMSSKEGMATGADVANFATGGATILIFDDVTV